MSREQNQQSTVPTVMQIIIAVGAAAGMTSDTLMGDARDEDIIRARAAVFKIADEYGHSYREIMFYINRNRTVAFNYMAKLRGHLQRDQVFMALCDQAKLKIAKLKPRAIREAEQQEKQWCIKNDHPEADDASVDTNPVKAEPEPTPEPREPKIPQFEAWKGKLGWGFTSEEVERMHYATREAERWFKKHYCQRAGSPTNKEPIPSTPTPPPTPELLPTTDAALYIGISTDLLKKGVNTGRLSRVIVPGTRGFSYYTSELNEFKEYLIKAKIIK